MLIGMGAVSACNSGSETTTGPTQVKCQVALSTDTASVGGNGGNATVNVTASPECPWDVSSGVNWLSDVSPRSGQGTATVEFRVAANPQPVARTGEILVNDNRLNVSQAAGIVCTFRLQPGAVAVGAGGGSRDITISVGNDCAWTISADASWLEFTSATSGRGDGRVGVRIGEHTGDDVRVATLALADQRLTVTQSPQSAECSYDVALAAASPLAATGATATAAVTTTAGCAWTASSTTEWIVVASGGSGTGRGTTVFNVAPNAGDARSGTVVVAGRAFTLTQASATAPPCGFAIAPASASVGAAGGGGTIAVTAGPACGWTGVSNDSWITVTGDTGSGTGVVTYTAAANTGVARTGTVSVAGQTFTVSQAAAATPCTYAVAPQSVSIAAAGDARSVAVTTTASCAWTTVSNHEWLVVTSGASGSGNGPVAFTAAANAGGARAGTLTVAGQTVTVTQSAAAASCVYSLSTTSAAIAAGGGTGSVTVSTASGCGWTAASNAGWITVTGGASGNGPVTFSVAANSGGARTGTLTIASRTFTVTQAAPVSCDYDISPRNTTVSDRGGRGSFTVTTTAGCAWTARSDESWITITAGASGTGSGSVQFDVDRNRGRSRSGTITAGGRTFTVRQDDDDDE